MVGVFDGVAVGLRVGEGAGVLASAAFAPAAVDPAGLVASVDTGVLSAATGEGTDLLTGAVARRAGGVPVHVTIHADCRNGRLMQYIAQHAQVHDRSYRDCTARIEAVMAAGRLEQLRTFGRDVRIVAAGP